MTVLSTWLEISTCYKESRPSMLRPLFINGGVRQTWPAWTIVFAGAALVVAHSLDPNSTYRALATFGGVILFILAVFLIKDRALAWNFQVYYQQHRLDKLPFFRREEHLRYAIFLETLQARKKTAAEVKDLLRIVETAEDPGKPSLTSQNLIIVTLLGALVTVSANLLTKTAIWEANKGLIFLLPILLGLYITWLIIDITKHNQHRSRLIIRALERAHYDIKLKEQTESCKINSKQPDNNTNDG
ncbi:hypothetical protein SAMN03159511_0503 [Pseudomonas sp. NFACC19-2]|nr:hypothetical protein [Pseudomonas sp. NFACC19-2]SFW63670.1 hypothetical protein SAMN03159511_0503 [Pseudomonas sp. NFACC19-2]